MAASKTPERLEASSSVLGYVTVPDHVIAGTCITPIGKLDTYDGRYVPCQGSVLNIKIGYLLACCGSSSITHVGHGWDDERSVQGFICHLFRTMNWHSTYYFIAASYQLEEGGDFKYGTTATILQRLGAKEVDASPNRNHGPHKMHLHVWNPNCDHDGWKEFLDFGPYNANPLWFAKLSAEDQQKELDKGATLLKLYEEYKGRQDEANKKARLDNRVWDAYYLIRDGYLTDRLAHFGLKVVDKHGNEPTLVPKAKFI